MGFEQLELRITKNTYFFTPLYEPSKNAPSSSVNTLTVYRNSGQLQLNAPAEKSGIEKQFAVHGILGFIELSEGECMIVITDSKKVGSLPSEIFQATSFQLLPIRNERFFWNKHLCTKTIEACKSSKAGNEFSEFVLPVIQGFVSIQNTAINHKPVTFALISRRSCERAGTRYFSRGLDQYGNASNFVETEQILLYEESLNSTQFSCFSYIQTRGSIPALWRQIPNMRYTPQLWIDPDISQTIEASRTHFEKQISYYGPQVLVNLVNKKGYEYSIGNLYSTIVDQLRNLKLKYVHFDFHYQCKKMRWNRVQVLIDQLEDELLKQGFCFYRSTSKPCLDQIQTSVVRTNCMDCLDRTNVVQSALGRHVLTRQLRLAGILQSLEVIENDDQFLHVFKNMWADNADALSISYSGTKALKTDFTRTGTRNYGGVFNDLCNSIVRYFKNNYRDGSRQDGIDLVLGFYRVKLDAPPRKNGGFIIYTPVYFVLAFLTFLVLLCNPQMIGSTLIWIFLLSLSLAVILYCGSFIQHRGGEFVDWPKLIPLARTEDTGFFVTSTDLSKDTELGYELPTIKKMT
ncbi:SacI homology domain-containing protein [Sporodiniella umbellata]|nr:SacI homology domain-containing protein [Sporodiniella umbellata]